MGLSAAQLALVREGMKYEEVYGLIGRPELVVSQRGDQSSIFRWSRDDVRMLGRFEDGVLVRMSVQGTPSMDTSKPDAPRQITDGQYDEVREGMPLESVMALFDVEGRPVSEGAGNVTIYKWTDDMGSSFTARFENDVLVRKTGLFVAPLPKEEKQEPALDAQGESGQEAADEMDALPPRRERRDVDWEAYAPQESSPPAQAQEEAPTAKAAAPRVTVARSERRAREAAQLPPEMQGRSYRPKAKLPDFTYSLRHGVYEVRVKNEGDSAVQVGLRADKRGRDARIAPGGSTSFHVDQGTYTVYYIYASAPYSLQTGRTLSIDGQFIADLSITLYETSVGGAP